jgi:hypothetical protein
LVSRRTVAEVPLALREGVLWPVFLLTVSLAGFGLVGALFVQEPLELLSAVTRLPFVGSSAVVLEVPVSGREDPQDEFSEPVAYEFEVPIIYREVRSVSFQSDQNLVVATRPFLEVKPGAALDVIGGEELTWLKGAQTTNPFLDADVSGLYIRNQGSKPATLELTVRTAPPHPEISTVPITACSVAAFFLLYLLQCVLAPRVSAIALATYKSEAAQPLFAILLVLGIVALAAYVFIPYNTFGEDI